MNHDTKKHLRARTNICIILSAPITTSKKLLSQNIGFYKMNTVVGIEEIYSNFIELHLF